MASLQRVFLVEDDPDIQTVARLALEAVGGFTVEICSSGQQALQQVENFAPDLIVLDVMMPDMDGPTVLQHLRARPGNCARADCFHDRQSPGPRNRLLPRDRRARRDFQTVRSDGFIGQISRNLGA